MQSFKRGFTLIELSIVLVIIGLIVGGVFVGSDLIKAAQRRSIVSAHLDFEVRWNTFKLKYACIPGDCGSAAQIFGTSAACPASTSPGTCNGNNDGWINWVSIPIESTLIWNHLNLADLANGYVGDEPTLQAAYYVVAPTKDRFQYWFLGGSVGRYAQLYPSVVCDNTGTDMQGIALQSAGQNTPGQGFAPNVAIDTVFNTYSIDVKFDDGRPCSGRFHASGGVLSGAAVRQTCITGTSTASVYDLTQTAINCIQTYKIQQ